MGMMLLCQKDLMEFYQVILIIFGILFIVVGILGFSDSYLRSQIEFGNMLRGTTSKITKGTLVAQKVTHIIVLLFGVVLIALAFFFPWRSFESL